MLARRFTRRGLLKMASIAGLWATASATLSGCVPQTEPAAPPAKDAADTKSDATSSVAPKEKIVVRMMGRTQQRWTNGTSYGVEEYMRLNPHITVEVEDVVYGEIAKKTETGFIAGTLQDICIGHNRWLWYGAFKGIYASVEDYIEASPPDDFDDFFPLGLDAVRFEGKLYCLPVICRPGPFSAIHYNKTLLDEMGVPEPEPPWTFEDLAEMATKCTDADKGYFGASWPMSDIHRVTNYTRYFGKPTLDDQSSWLMEPGGKKFRMETPTILQAVTLYLELAHKTKAIPLAGDQVQGGLFNAGRVAFELGTIPAEQALRNTVGDRFEFANIMPPTGPDGRIGTMNVGNQFMMNTKAKHPDETWGLLKSLVSKEAAVRGALETMEPGRKSAWLDPRVVEKIPLYKEGAATMESSLEGFPMPWNLRYVEANNVFLNEAGLIWQGDKTWEEQSPIVQQKVQEIVDLDRP